MNPTEALQVLEQALNAANLKGVYSLTDANKIIEALKTVSSNITPVEIDVMELKRD